MQQQRSFSFKTWNKTFTRILPPSKGDPTTFSAKLNCAGEREWDGLEMAEKYGLKWGAPSAPSGSIAASPEWKVAHPESYPSFKKTRLEGNATAETEKSQFTSNDVPTNTRNEVKLWVKSHFPRLHSWPLLCDAVRLMRKPLYVKLSHGMRASN